MGEFCRTLQDHRNIDATADEFRKFVITRDLNGYRTLLAKTRN